MVCAHKAFKKLLYVNESIWAFAFYLSLTMRRPIAKLVAITTAILQNTFLKEPVLKTEMYKVNYTCWHSQKNWNLLLSHSYYLSYNRWPHNQNHCDLYAFQFWNSMQCSLIADEATAVLVSFCSHEILHGFSTHSSDILMYKQQLNSSCTSYPSLPFGWGCKHCKVHK